MPENETNMAPEAKQPDFEQSAARLEEIIRALESGRAPLAESLRLYEEGVSLINTCSALLDGAEKKIKILQRTSGGMTEEDFNRNDN